MLTALNAEILKGIAPLSWLFSKDSSRNLGSAEMLQGMPPTRRLFASRNEVRFLRALKLAGIYPVSWLLSSHLQYTTPIPHSSPGS
jgi:hypothetical protein